MPVIYYTKYRAEGRTVREVKDLEHRWGLRLLMQGLQELFSEFLTEEELAGALSIGAEGKPYLLHRPEVQFNITHCSGLVCCAFSKAPVGVDAEPVDSFPEVLVKRILSKEEQAALLLCGTEEERNALFFRYWTLKEAYVKCLGTGMDADLRQVSFQAGGSLTAGRWAAIPCSDPAVRARQTVLLDRYVLALCEQRERQTAATEGRESDPSARIALRYVEGDGCVTERAKSKGKTGSF